MLCAVRGSGRRSRRTREVGGLHSPGPTTKPDEKASDGGAGGVGVVFKLKPSSSGWRETVLYTFVGFGRNPNGAVIFDPAGNLYGTAMWRQPRRRSGV